MIETCTAPVSVACSPGALGVKYFILSDSTRMSETRTKNQPAPVAPVHDTGKEPRPSPTPREIGGPKGPEPTRYGDWEKGGRCIDF